MMQKLGESKMSSQQEYQQQAVVARPPPKITRHARCKSDPFAGSLTGSAQVPPAVGMLRNLGEDSGRRPSMGSAQAPPAAGMLRRPGEESTRRPSGCPPPRVINVLKSSTEVASNGDKRAISSATSRSSTCPPKKIVCSPLDLQHNCTSPRLSARGCQDASTPRTPRVATKGLPGPARTQMSVLRSPQTPLVQASRLSLAC
jgi:hypothetical protein